MKKITKKELREMSNDRLLEEFRELSEDYTRACLAFECLPAGSDRAALKVCNLIFHNQMACKAEILKRLER